jgi:alpha-glucosidase
VMFVDSRFRDNPVVGTERNAFGDPVEREIRNKNQPELHGVLKRLRRLADENHAVLVGETWTDDIDQLKAYYGEHDDEVALPMDFMFTTVDRLSPAAFRKQIEWVNGSGGWPVYVLSNHDIRRVYDRYGDGVHDDQIAKLMASLYLTLRGTAVMYYGEEIGMENHDPQRPEDVRDSMGKAGWPRNKGRDGERTPMQWSAGPNAGFSAATPWLGVGDRYERYNVETEKKDPASILNYYRRLLALRHTNEALVEGESVDLNMSGTARKVALALAPKGLHGTTARTLLASFAAPARVDTDDIRLEPFGAWIGALD